MRVYAELAAAAFRQYSTYRVATAAGVFTNSVFGLIRASVLLATVDLAGGDLNGYTPIRAATYTWLGQALLAPIEVFGTREIADRVKSGDIATDLLRPVSLLPMLLAQKYGRAGFQLIFRGIPPLLIGGLITGISLPTSPLTWILGFASLALAIAVSFLFDAMVNLTAFWLIENRGLETLARSLVLLLSGNMVPVAWFPAWLGAIAAASPFPSMVQTPIDLISGRVTEVDALRAIGIQVAWLVILTLAAQAMLRTGQRRLEVQGG